MKELLLILFLLHHSLGKYVCKDDSYTLNISSCYKYFESRQSFSRSRDVCLADNAILLRIDSQEENDFINATFARFAPFWIGFNDIITEGDFRWTDNQVLSVNAYKAWIDGDATATNTESFDCVRFNQDGFWEVEQQFCENSELAFVCRQSACNSTDGLICDEDRVPTETSLGPGIIAVIVIIPLVIVVIIIIVIVLLYLWKYENDLFNKYICCCISGGSKAHMNSLKQEIQRLQTELSQQKLNSSGRFQSPLSRQQTQVSLQPTAPQPIQNVPKLSRSLSSNRVLPINSPISTAPIRPPMLGRGMSTGAIGGSLIKPQLSAVSEENSTKEES